jgi:hypothetical protein
MSNRINLSKDTVFLSVSFSIISSVKLIQVQNEVMDQRLLVLILFNNFAEAGFGNPVNDHRYFG